jgi:RNA polymerase sigma-70 factor (ECF subfamily)
LTLDALVGQLVTPPADYPESRAEGNEARALVREAIESLGLKQRIVVVLYYLEGLKLSEIAYVLDCPVGTVKSRLYYACKALRRQLSEAREAVGRVAYGTF